MKTQRGKSGCLLFAVIVMIFICTCCGKTAVDEEKSPALTGAEITSCNEGTESSQYVKVALTFDKAISVQPDQKDTLRITIAGNRIDADDYVLEQGDQVNTAELIISVDAVTDGILKIGKSEKADTITGIQDETQTYAAKEFELEGIIPSGVCLSTVQSGEGYTVKQVDSSWNIRSIAWIGLLEDGELIPAAETRAGEMLDGYAAVHGHEFLMEDEVDIGEKIVEVLSSNYGEEYSFSCEDNLITVQNVNGKGTPDIEIYGYLKVNGDDISEAAEEKGQEGMTSEGTVGENGDDSEAEDSHEAGMKKKVTEQNREITAKEQEQIDCLSISRIAAEGITDGTDLYRTVTITGSAMPEQQIYSLYDLEELYRISYGNIQMNQLGLAAEYEDCIGLDFMKFLDLCGADMEQENLFLNCQGNTEKRFSIDSIQKDSTLVLLVLGVSGTDSGQEGVMPELLVIQEGKTERIEQLSRVFLGTGETIEDPEYGFHNRDPWLESADAVFTVEVYRKGAEYLGAVSTKSFTTTDMENLMREYPEAAAGNYYGTIGNEESYPYMGVGGWLDYFEGIDLRWLLTEQVGIDSLAGSAEMVGRDGEVYAVIDDLSYIEQSQDAEAYYVLTAEGVRISEAIPMISCVKNGYPILPEHEHESAGYVAYNRLNQSLEQAGVETEVGVVKNHNGPFIACFGNRDGYYGGNEVETGGDCVLLRLYLDE
ncbi:MAG: hypothetical protein ACI4D3_15090 [Lachnospiraceae bacterium]